MSFRNYSAAIPIIALLAACSAFLFYISRGLDPAFFVFVPAVGLAAWYMHLRGGIAAAFFSTLFVWFFLTVPLWSFQLESSVSAGRVVMFFAVNICTAIWISTQRRNHEFQRELAERREEIIKERETFLALVSHELRTPLANIIGWTHLMKEQAQGDGRLASIADVILRNASLQHRLIDDLLQAARFRAGKLELTYRPLEIDALVTEEIRSIAPFAKSKRITIQNQIESAPPINGDVDRMRQVISNILINAIKFTPEGGEVCVRVTNGDKNVTVQISDTGPGIPPDQLPFVFEEFRQGQSGSGGLGLGLSIAKRLVEMHGGVIEAVNREKGGAMFTVRLPISTAGRP